MKSVEHLFVVGDARWSIDERAARQWAATSRQDVPIVRPLFREHTIYCYGGIDWCSCSLFPYLPSMNSKKRTTSDERAIEVHRIASHYIASRGGRLAFAYLKTSPLLILSRSQLCQIACGSETAPSHWLSLGVYKKSYSIGFTQDFYFRRNRDVRLCDNALVYLVSRLNRLVNPSPWGTTDQISVKANISEPQGTLKVQTGPGFSSDVYFCNSVLLRVQSRTAPSR
ncbi:uncharacterized protein FFUJ_05562 [Fusarium fujikuroi IMI 58289]|uniref:Uncharacterized protein n=1 Tax=Gibberella fujikuroi (strain CBS 195.34 / IMI 58289 / NRRL A-6831) TaxID=1279085 RepID=S0EB34_GIBF5|nr:uncharacterized protein FFUJ_05562 [Fusarium fujikuroi IMI 58289]CCT69658.1 uncharacterized protein FFUJ_05562 [Fusarium fujikuroi IMI 58289]SCO26965.1 uncharacterized protein FFM5_15234 [Fusarium fujikuroi]